MASRAAQFCFVELKAPRGASEFRGMGIAHQPAFQNFFTFIDHDPHTSISIYLYSTKRFRTYVKFLRLRAHELVNFYLISCNVAFNLLDQTTRVSLELLQLCSNTNSNLQSQLPKSSRDFKALFPKTNTIACRCNTI